MRKHEYLLPISAQPNENNGQNNSLSTTPYVNSSSELLSESQCDNISNETLVINDSNHLEIVIRGDGTNELNNVNENIGNEISIAAVNTENLVNESVKTDSLNKSIIEFSLTLHNNNNFNRKNVFEIQKLVAEKLLSPAMSLLNNFFSSKSVDDETKCFLDKFINDFSNPFDFCKS